MTEIHSYVIKAAHSPTNTSPRVDQLTVGTTTPAAHRISSLYWIQLLILLLCLHSVGAQNPAAKKPLQTIPVDKVWSGHPVGFDILTTERYQYAAYYNADRQMVIARRLLQSKTWEKQILPSTVGWDSHNYIAIASDKEGFLHVSGNMHGVPLVYFRSQKPWEISAFDKLSMTGKNEERVTYPVFFKDQKGTLYFQYRNGGSGDGITYWNTYDTETKQWRSLFDTPLFDGEKEANAYMTNPKLGPDGYFYTVWMWRLNPIANTNHNLSCMRSRDLVHWENMRGDKINLPAKWSDDLAIVDPVGPWNGLINMGFNISWDKNMSPYITYHKYDASGRSQVFISRWEKAAGKEYQWTPYQISNWKDFKWSLNKAGSLANSLGISTIRETEKGEITVDFYHEKYGEGSWLLDKNSLKVKQEVQAVKKDDTSLLPPLAVNEAMSVRTKKDNTGQYIMRWQTLGTNQDRARPGTPPDPVELIIYQIR